VHASIAAIGLLCVLGSRAAADTPGAGLDAQPQALFEAGAKEFEQRWVVAPSPFGNWGRGPTSNGESCTDCHIGGGRGRPPESEDEPLRAGLLRISIPGRDPHGAPLPHPAYGDQLQYQGVLGKVPGEGEVYVRWRTHAVSFADGALTTLRRPVIELRDLDFGPLGNGTLLSLRIAPPLAGVGMLQAISDQVSPAQPLQGGGGHANTVWDYGAQRTVPGRFGWKANQPSLRQQIASALLNDLGVTSDLFPEENCPAVQSACRAFPRPAAPEARPEQLDAIEFYLRWLPPPARRNTQDPQVRAGERLFDAAGCAGCHTPEMRSAQSTIRPYTDLLLHDMGEGLADGRPDFDAGPRDWRTPPLWGIGRDEGPFLHDGRARTLAEAILWHGGEAHPARERFRTMAVEERAALLAFLGSL
jgi:CxxC motif-containing protein (DUF1111 family)